MKISTFHFCKHIRYTKEVLAEASMILADITSNCSHGNEKSVIITAVKSNGSFEGNAFETSSDSQCAKRAAFWADGLQHARLTAAAVQAATASDPCTLTSLIYEAFFMIFMIIVTDNHSDF